LPTSDAISVIKEPPSDTGNESTWQKIKNFFGMGDKKHSEEIGKEKALDQNNLKTDKVVAENTIPSDFSHTSTNKPIEDKDLQNGYKKLDISDDFFNDVEKHLQEEDKLITNTTGAEESNLKAASKLDQPSASVPMDSAVNSSENIGKHEADKTEAINLPQGMPLPDDEEATHNLQQKEEKPKEQNAKSNESKPIVDSKSFAVSKFKEEIERRNAKRSEGLPIIPEKDLSNSSDQSLNNVLATDAKQLKFITDEAKVLIIPNDDVVLGELTENATLELMDFSSYVQMFWQDYNREKKADDRQVISDFIDNYDENFNQVKWPLSSDDPYEKLSDAFATIGKQDINKFIIILNNYPILEVKDKEQNSMLHQAAYVGNYPAAKLLIMKGLSLNDVNMKDETPLAIADKYNNPYVAYLLKQAGASSFSKLE
jgi:hypothetical protein